MPFQGNGYGNLLRMEICYIWRVTQRKSLWLNTWWTLQGGGPRRIACPMDAVYGKDCNGNSDKIRFWEDAWCNGSPFAAEFPGLYRFNMRKGGVIGDHMTAADSIRTWSFHFRRNLRNWEADSMLELNGLLNRVKFGSVKTAGNGRGQIRGSSLSAASMNMQLDILEEQTAGLTFPDFKHKLVWKRPIPSKVKFFTWCAVHGKLPVAEFLCPKDMCPSSICPL